MRTIYALNLANMASIMLAQVAIVPLLIKALGVAQYEHWLYLFSISGICGLSAFGIDVYGSNLARMAYAGGDNQTAQKAIGITLSLLLQTVLVFSLAAAIWFVLVPTNDNLALCLMIAAAPLASCRAFLGYLLTARTSQIGELVAFIAFNLLQTSALALAAWWDGRAVALATAFLISILIFGIAPLVAAIKRRAPDVSLMPARLTLGQAVEHYRLALPTFSYSAATAAITYLPVVIMASVPGVPTGGTAAFAVSRTLVGVVRQFCLQLARSNGIELSRFLAPENAGRLRALFISGSAATATLAATGLGALPPIANILIATWTHRPELFEMVTIIVFCIGGVLSAMVQVPMLMPQFTNQAQLMVRPLAIQMALVIILGAAGATLFHAAGMASALSVAELATVGWVSIQRIVPRLNIAPLRFILGTGAPALVMMVASAALSLIARWIVAPETFVDLIWSGLIWSIGILPLAYGVFHWINANRAKLLAA